MPNLLSRLLSTPSPDRVDAAFSLRGLLRQNAALARHYLWDCNRLPVGAAPLWLHFGCGERVLEGFTNLDFIPHDARVLAWNLLDRWPDVVNRAEGIFSEDVLEHFFYPEQAYILCNWNRILRGGRLARVLMPSLAKLVAHREGYAPQPGEFLADTFGVETGGDALNMGMRFSGHRWLHDQASLATLAGACGFEALPTACAKSAEPKFDGLNIRDETNSLSFANDLRKVRHVERLTVQPGAIEGAERIEEVADGIALYVAVRDRPTVDFAPSARLAVEAVPCINLFSSNLSSFAEHNLKSLQLDGGAPWFFDETLKSRPAVNIVPRNQLRLAAAGRADFGALRFSPAAAAGEYFTLGCAEIFVA